MKLKRQINKKNMQLFARTLCETRNGEERYKVMCAGAITDYDGSHCVVGEMYEYFTGNPATEDGLSMSTKTCINILSSHARLNKNRNFIKEPTGLTNCDGITYEIEDICGKVAFCKGLDLLTEVNDFSKSSYDRAKNCQKYIRQIAKVLA